MFCFASREFLFFTMLDHGRKEKSLERFLYPNMFLSLFFSWARIYLYALRYRL